jgi:transcription initiation factor TFIIIB Brf1 subunit/transcription initiation factor TFIIB
MDKFCSDCWEWVDTVEDENGETVCAECEWVNVFDSEIEADEALRWDADLARGEMERDEMMFAMMD